MLCQDETKSSNFLIYFASNSIFSHLFSFFFILSENRFSLEIKSLSTFWKAFTTKKKKKDATLLMIRRLNVSPRADTSFPLFDGSERTLLCDKLSDEIRVPFETTRKYCRKLQCSERHYKIYILLISMHRMH